MRRVVCWYTQGVGSDLPGGGQSVAIDGFLGVTNDDNNAVVQLAHV